MPPGIAADGEAGLQAAEANNASGALREMFNLAEVWGYRPARKPRLIVDDKLALILRHLEKLEAEGLEN